MLSEEKAGAPDAPENLKNPDKDGKKVEKTKEYREPAEEEDAQKQEELKRPESGYNKDRMKLLWFLLGLLTVILIAVVIYELILGYGLRETGSERMRSTQMTEAQTEIASSGEYEQRTTREESEADALTGQDIPEG